MVQGVMPALISMKSQAGLGTLEHRDAGAWADSLPLVVRENSNVHSIDVTRR